jgi:hypothetical protein
MEQADRILFVASALLECRQTLKERLRLCAELDRISVTVRRMERALDEYVGNARDDAWLAHAQSEASLMRPARPAKPRLRVVAGGAA